LEYKESELPNTSVSSREVSKAWANRFAQSLPAVDLLVTSEPYGEYVAEYMCIKHISFNADRSTVSISSTDIRNDLLRHWHTIPEAVQKHLQQKVAILGTESTGKTTLANKLAGVFSGQVVEEAARGIIENSTEYSKEDLIKTAIVHAECIKTAVANTTQPLVVIDTDAYITQSYAYFEFGVSIELPGWVYDENNVDLRLYLSADIPYVQDGTRMPKDIRNKLDEQHRKTLGVYSQDFVEINGDYSEREVQAIAKINALYSVFRHVDGAEQ
jgi:HTH-type transcriptional repressor of NAD biosynthesis genes